MDSPLTAIDNASYLVPPGGAAAGMVALAGRTGGSSGSLATQATDQQVDIEDSESLVATNVGMWLGPEGTAVGDENGAESADREYPENGEAQEADLVALQGDATQRVSEQNVETATDAFQVDDLVGTLHDGSDATAQMPGEVLLTGNGPDTRPVSTADFTPVKRGSGDGYILQTVPAGIQVESKNT